MTNKPIEQRLSEFITSPEVVKTASVVLKSELGCEHANLIIYINEPALSQLQKAWTKAGIPQIYVMAITAEIRNVRSVRTGNAGASATADGGAAAAAAAATRTPTPGSDRPKKRTKTGTPEETKNQKLTAFFESID